MFIGTFDRMNSFKVLFLPFIWITSSVITFSVIFPKEIFFLYGLIIIPIKTKFRNSGWSVRWQKLKGGISTYNFVSECFLWAQEITVFSAEDWLIHYIYLTVVLFAAFLYKMFELVNVLSQFLLSKNPWSSLM